MGINETTLTESEYKSGVIALIKAVEAQRTNVYLDFPAANSRCNPTIGWGFALNGFTPRTLG